MRSDKRPSADASIYGQLDGAGDALDQLKAQVSGGIRSQGHFDELEEQAGGIAVRIMRAFRGGRR